MAEIGINLYKLAYYFGLVLGTVMFLIGIKKLIEHSKNPNDPRNGLGSVIVLFIGASMLWSLQSSINLFSNTFNGTGSSFCVYDNNFEGVDDADLNKHGAECFNAKDSDITADLRDKLEQKGATASLEELNKKIQGFFYVIQSLGLIYFIKGIYQLKAASEGSGSSTFGKSLIMIIMSSLVMDMPDTLEIIINTFKQMQAT